ncbi:MAG: hypothetical protein FWF08_00570 [Oscillospiraceae bacterium]|nr:hypothetical protein [Oscillospiraceae bacterium]
MERGATAKCIFKFPGGIEFEEVEDIRLYVAGDESGAKLTKIKGGGDMEFLGADKIAVFFSQEDTLKFGGGEVLSMQWHWRNKDGTARVSKIIETDIYKFLGSEAI